jgi:hypothetical protein
MSHAGFLGVETWCQGLTAWLPSQAAERHVIAHRSRLKGECHLVF